MKKPLVSIIVTTKNSDKTLNKCLKSIVNQTYNNTEIIVIDNNSTDNTKQIAKKYTDNIFDKGPERSAQRNYGVQKSRGEYLLILDSDMTLSKQVVEECVTKMQNSDVVGLYIPEIIAGNSFWSKMRTFERSFYNATVIDAVRFVRKKDVEKIGGFDETLTGPEDWDFDIRIRQIGKTDIIKNPLYHHEDEISLRTYVSKKSYYMDSMERYRKKWPNNADVAKQFSPYYRFIGVFIENGKWKKLFSNVTLMIALFTVRMLIGITFLVKSKKT